VEGTLEGNDLRAPGVVARKFDCAFYRFGARVCKEYLGLAHIGLHCAREILAELHHRFVIKISAADMEKLSCRILDCLDHLRVGMACRGHRDACHEIKIRVAIDIVHVHAFAMGHHERVFLDVGGRGDRMIAIDQGLGLGTGRRSLDLGAFCDFHGLKPTALYPEKKRRSPG